MKDDVKPTIAIPSDDWRQAAGNCGFSVPGPVFAAWVHGIALFAFESNLSTPEKPAWFCVITGNHSVTASSLEETKLKGEGAAKIAYTYRSSRNISKEQFENLVNRSSS